MLHPDVQRFLDEEAAALPGPAAGPVSVEEMRAAHDASAPHLSGPGEPVAEVRDITVPAPEGPVGLRIYRPEGDGPLPVVAWTHGGGWVSGSLDGYDGLCRALANAAGAVVASIDYRLAPEHPFPAALEDVLAAVRWLAAHAGELGGDGERILVAGDSAGGNLSAVCARRLRDEGGPALRGQVLIYPVCDSATDTPSFAENAEGWHLAAEDMRRYWRLYLDGADGAVPDASPLRVPDFAGLPSAYVLTLERDVLRDEAEAYASALRRAGVPVEHRRHDDSVHGVLRWLAIAEPARRMKDEVAGVMRAMLA